MADDLVLTAMGGGAPAIEDCRPIAREPQGARTVYNGVDLVHRDVGTHPRFPSNPFIRRVPFFLLCSFNKETPPHPKKKNEKRYYWGT